MSDTPRARWYASPWNFEASLSDGVPAAPLRFHDVTLRDGEQQSGMVFRHDERVAIACALAEAGVDRIEVGMPSESAEDRALFDDLVRRNLPAQLFAFSGYKPGSVRIARECGAAGILLKVVTSEHLLRNGYREEPERAFRAAIETASEAREAGLYTVLFTIDATRTPLAEYLDIVERIVTEGRCSSVAVADSYGAALPHAVAGAVRALRARLSIPVEIHCHDDFGLAVANTLAGVAAGAEVAHVTVSGIGERAGNAALEDTAMALRCLYGIETGIRTEALYRLSRMVQESGKFKLPSNRSIVGEHLYRIESGVVAMLHRRCKDTAPLEYLPFLPEVAGRPPVELVFGKGSGTANLEEHIERRGIPATPDETARMAELARAEAREKGRLLSAEELDGIVRRARASPSGRSPSPR